MSPARAESNQCVLETAQNSSVNNLILENKAFSQDTEDSLIGANSNIT